MKSHLILLLSILIAITFIAPSVVTLLSLDKDTATLVDIDEEEKNDIDEKDVFFHPLYIRTLVTKNTTKIGITSYVPNYDSKSSEIFLLPPISIG
jgi:hypothetical protein